MINAFRLFTERLKLEFGKQTLKFEYDICERNPRGSSQSFTIFKHSYIIKKLATW